MSEDIIGVSIKAFEEFEDAFNKFHDGLNKTEQGEKRIVESTESVNKAMSTMIKILTDMAQEQKKGTDTSERFYEAFRQLASAEKAAEQQIEKLSTALNEQGDELKKAQAEIKRLNDQMDNNRKSSQNMRGSIDDLLGVLGQVGILYAFSQGLREILRVGTELEAQLTKVSAITKESISSFEGFIYGNKGSLFAPAEQAEAMIDLGAAGMQSADMLMALPEVFDLATAGLVDLEQATVPVLNVLKTFEEPIENTTHIVDAFVEAANRSALQVEDLSLSMAMSSAAAKLAGMDYQELTTILMILRDAGLQASDAGTSVKSAILAMMNPSKEAIEYMDQLGISIYDVQGNMKDWADIVGEFERGLAGLTEQERNLVLSTIAGSDGIRALSLSMGKGSSYIRQTTNELKNADGAAREVAAVMEETFDATLKRTNNNLQLMAATIFNDVEPALTSILGVFNDVVEGLTQMDEGTRKMVEGLVGTAGLAMALLFIIDIVKRLTIAMRALFVGMGPWGWVILAVSGVAMGLMQAAGAAEEAKRKQEELNREAEEYNRIQREGIDKSQIEQTKQRIAEMDKEIAKLRELKAAREETLRNLQGKTGENMAAGLAMGRASAEIKDYNKQIDDLIKKRNILNEATEKAIALDTDLAQKTANKAIQTKIEIESTVKLIDEYVNLEKQGKLTGDQQQRLAELAGTLGDKYPYLIAQIDEHGRATRLNTKELENQKTVLKALAQAEIDNARATMQANLAKTQTVLDQAKKRIRILIQEQETLRRMAAFIGDGIGGQAEAQMTDYVSEQIRRQQDEINNASAAVEIYKAGLESLNNIKVGPAPVKTLGTTGSGKGSKSTGPDPFTEAMNLFNYQKELSDMSTDAQIANLKRIRDAFIQSGKWTLEQHRQIDTQIVQLQRQRMQEQLNYSRTWIETERSLNRLTTEEEIAAWERVKAKYKLTREEMMQIDVTIYQLQDQARQEQVEKAKAWIDEQVFYDRMSVEEQISAWERLKTTYSLTAEEIKDVDRNIYSLRKEMLSDYMSDLRESYSQERDDKLERLREEEEAELDSLNRRRKAYEKAHKARMDQLNAETEAAVKALQEQIEAIEQQGRDEDQAKKEEDRNQRLLDLQAEYEKYRNATSAAGIAKREEIEQEIADIQWEIQREANERARQEQIDALQEEMDNIRDQAEQKKEQWQADYEAQQEHFAEEQESIRDHYAEIEEETRKHYKNLLNEANLQAEAAKALQQQKQNETITMLQGFGPLYKSAGSLLGSMFADGIRSQFAAVVSAARSLAEAASDYLELHSPAKKGPLSTLDEWWRPMGQMLAGGMDRGPVESAAGGIAGAAAAGGGGNFTLEVYIENFYGTQENIDELSAGLRRVYDWKNRSRGRRG